MNVTLKWNIPTHPVSRCVRCEVLGRSLLAVVFWFLGSRVQIRILTTLSDGGLNTSNSVVLLVYWRLCLVVNCNGGGASAWEKLTASFPSLYLSSAAPRCCVEIQSGCILLFTMLHGLLTYVTKSERLFALEIFLSYPMCIWRKLLQLTFFSVGKCCIGFFCIYWGLLQFCLLYYRSSFFRYHFLKSNYSQCILSK